MAYSDKIRDKQDEFDGAIDHFRKEAVKLRTGRANPAMVENLLVDYYGTKTPLKQISTISVPEPRLITIQPWSVDTLTNIETAIRNSDLGLNPSNDGRLVRIAIPPLTEERRKDLVKVLNQRAEDARIAVRNAREEIWREIQKEEKEGLIAEDDKFKSKDELQEVVDEYNKKIEEIRQGKETEIMKV